MSGITLRLGEQKIGRRQGSRLRVRLPARLVTLHGTSRAALADVSQWGARIEASGTGLRVGENAVLTWEGFEVFGRIVWNDGVAIGMRFEEPLSLGQLTAIRDLADARPVASDKEGVRDAARAFVQGGRRWL